MPYNWENKTMTQLIEELKRHERQSREAAERYKEAERSKRYRDVDLAEMRQEIAEDGMVRATLQKLIAERYVIESGQNKHTAESSHVKLSRDELATHLEAAKAHAKEGDYHLVEVACNTILQSDPANAVAYYQRGMALVHLGQDELAVKDFTSAIQFQPDLVDSYWQRAEVYKRLKQYRLRSEDITQVINLSSQYRQAYVQRGLAYYLLHQYHEALADFSEAIRLYPTELLAYYYRAGVYADLGDYERALADCEKFMQLDPEEDLIQYRIKDIRRKQAGG